MQHNSVRSPKSRHIVPLLRVTLCANGSKSRFFSSVRARLLVFASLALVSPTAPKLPAMEELLGYRIFSVLSDIVI